MSAIHPPATHRGGRAGTAIGYCAPRMLRPLLALTVVLATFVCPLAATGVFSACHANEAPMECCDHHQGVAPQGSALALLGARGTPLDAPAAVAVSPPASLAPLLSTCELFAARAPLHPPRSHDPDRLTVFRI